MLDPQMLRRTVRQFIGTTLAIIIGLTAALWLTMTIVKPGPQGKIILATGGAGGLYHQLAQTYVAELARNGVTLELRPRPALRHRPWQAVHALCSNLQAGV